MKYIDTTYDVTIQLSGVEEPVTIPTDLGKSVWDQITKGADVEYGDPTVAEGIFRYYIPHTAIAMATAEITSNESEVEDENCIADGDSASEEESQDNHQ